MWVLWTQWANHLIDQRKSTGLCWNSGLTQERANTFHGFVDNFYSLKTKKIVAGRVALGDRLAHYRISTGVGIFA